MALTTRALAFASRWFDPAIVRRVFEPLVADWQREWNDGGPAQRTWISIRGLAAFTIAAFVSSPAIITAAPPRSVVSRMMSRVGWFVAVIAVVLTIPFVTQARSSWEMMPLTLLMLLLSVIPSGVVLAFPFSMLLAVDVIRREPDIAPHVARATAVKLALAAVVFMVVFHGFVMPAANQNFRELTYRQSLLSEADDVPALLRARYFAQRPARGLRESTTLELFTDAERQQPAERYTRAGAIRSELTNRAVLALMPAIFVWLRWIAHDVRRPRRFWPLPVAAMIVIAMAGFFGSYMTGLLVETTWHLRPGDGLWLPIIIAALFGIAQQRYTSRRSAAA
jgi:hypothetical protein